MKSLKILLVLPGLLAIQSVFSQDATHLTLSDQYPAAGEKITVTYDPSGTVVDGAKDITAIVFYYDDKDYSVADIDLQPDGKLLKGDFTIPAATKTFFLKISAGDKVDNNDKNGYVYLVYKDKKPVEEAYARESAVFSGMGSYLAKIKADNNRAIELYKKEFSLYPQSEKKYDAQYYIALSRDPANHDMVAQKIALLEKSADEKDLMMASSLLRATNAGKSVDSLSAVVKTKFPNGLMAKNELIMSFQREKDLAKKDSLYNVLITRFPAGPSDKNMMDNFTAQLIAGYLKAGYMGNYRKYVNQLNDKGYLMGTLNNTAWDWAVEGEHLDDAEEISKQSVEYAADQMAHPVNSRYLTAKQLKKNNYDTYLTYADTYGYVLLKNNKASQALKYAKEVYEQANPDDGNASGHYILVLAAVGQYDKALDIATTSMKNGQDFELLRNELKKDYIKVKGSDAGYDEYLASLTSAAKASEKANLAKSMLNQPAPAFTLKDFYGKLVSLVDLKGKIVIIDFWATWCGPCKASFPGMQLAVNKYKDDPNVKFLFADTFETDANYIAAVKKFIADNKYTFHVIEDEKGSDGRQSKLASAFDVDAIPTKFIIDKSGNIRFKYVGSSGVPEEILEEVTKAIDMIKNVSQDTPGQKSSK